MEVRAVALPKAEPGQGISDGTTASFARLAISGLLLPLAMTPAQEVAIDGSRRDLK